MSQAALSVRAFAVYMNVMGLLLLFVPNLVLGLLGLPTTTEIWIRVFGLFVAVVGVYYHQAAGHELRPFFQVSVVGRIAFSLGLVAFVVLGIGQPILLAFAAFEFGAALWTIAILRNA